MSEEPRVIDGADRRKRRLLEMLAFIANNGGATALEIKTFMLVKFGLRHKTAATYMQEAHLGGLITQQGIKWYITPKYRKLAKYLYA